MGFERELVEKMRDMYEGLHHEHIKEAVDKKGIHKFIQECSLAAGATGAVAGLGGPITMVVGVPMNIINTVVQQFRVTMGVIYFKRGVVTPAFDDFMKIVGLSVGIEVGVTAGTNLLLAIAGQILARLGANAAGMVVPIFGAAIGGGANYLFIRAIGKTLLNLDMRRIL